MAHKSVDGGYHKVVINMETLEEPLSAGPVRVCVYICKHVTEPCST